MNIHRQNYLVMVYHKSAIWNCLPRDLRHVTSIECFKSKVKGFISGHF